MTAENLLSPGQHPGIEVPAKPGPAHAATLSRYHSGILAAIELGLSNGRLEGLNSRVRLLTRRSYGFHSATAL
ncbi:MAG TPA: transposase, partial [Gaiellaceae bacterium]